MTLHLHRSLLCLWPFKLSSWVLVQQILNLTYGPKGKIEFKATLCLAPFKIRSFPGFRIEGYGVQGTIDHLLISVVKRFQTYLWKTDKFGFRPKLYNDLLPWSWWGRSIVRKNIDMFAFREIWYPKFYGFFGHRYLVPTDLTNLTKFTETEIHLNDLYRLLVLKLDPQRFEVGCCPDHLPFIDPDYFRARRRSISLWSQQVDHKDSFAWILVV